MKQREEKLKQKHKESFISSVIMNDNIDQEQTNSIPSSSSSIPSSSLLVTCPEVIVDNDKNNNNNNNGNKKNNDHFDSTSSSTTTMTDTNTNTTTTTIIPKADNDFDGYWKTYLEMNQDNINEGLHNFRHQTYDYRQDSYNIMKRRTRRYKRSYMGNVIQSNDNIYESACGQGFNLYMTLEILYEEYNIHNVTVYANDYLKESIYVANELFNIVAPQPNVFNVGSFCVGDSTNLKWISNETFDFAYTGFIDPLLDPLNLFSSSSSSKKNDDDDDDDDMTTTTSLYDVELIHEHLCASANGLLPGGYVDPVHVYLTNIMQQYQEEWHAKWVLELIRIVKPGKYIIIEDVGWPACSDFADWGGVEPDWWKRAIFEYHWDVYPESLQIVERAWYNDRYNVRMQRKRGKIIDEDGNEVDDVFVDYDIDEESKRLWDDYIDDDEEDDDDDDEEEEDDEDDDDEEEEFDDDEEEEYDDEEEDDE